MKAIQLRMARAALGWGVRELAEKAGVTAKLSRASKMGLTRNNRRLTRYNVHSRRLASSSPMVISLASASPKPPQRAPLSPAARKADGWPRK